MGSTGDPSRRDEPSAGTGVATAGEDLMRAIRTHADAVASADEAGARTARAAIRSAMSDYSWAITNAWEEVAPFPLPQTLREQEGPTPREIHLRTTYHLQVLDRDRLMDIAQQVSCNPVSDTAEAAAALYGARMWVPSEDTGLTYLIGGCDGRFEQA